MNLINTVTLDYPRSLWQLRKENPNVSFPVNPTDEDLAPFDHASVHPVGQPTDYDLRTRRVEEVTPRLNDGVWEQAWIIRDATPEEIAAYDEAYAPEPEWTAFGVTLALHPDVAALYETLPKPLSAALTVGLSDASKGDSRLFSGVWNSISGLIPEPLLQEILSLAQAHHLPAGFVELLAQPAP